MLNTNCEAYLGEESEMEHDIMLAASTGDITFDTNSMFCISIMTFLYKFSRLDEKISIFTEMITTVFQYIVLPLTTTQTYSLVISDKYFLLQPT